MKFKFLKAVAAGLILSASCLVNVANAGLINIGNGSTSDIDCTIGCMDIYQQAYDSSYFGSSSVTINSLSLFGKVGQSWFYSGVYDVYIGYMNGNYDSITTNYSSNFGSAATYTDTVNLATDMVADVLTVDLDFNYNTSLGDLLIQFTRTSEDSYGGFAYGTNYLWSRVYRWAGSNGTGGDSGYALNSRFDVSTAQVPEPSTLAIFALGLMGLVSRRFKKQ